MRKRDALAQFLRRKIEAGKVARVGLVAEAAIDRMRAGLDSGAQRGRRSRWTDKLNAHSPFPPAPPPSAFKPGQADFSQPYVRTCLTRSPA